MCVPAAFEAVVVQHLPDILRAVAVVSGELHALVPDLRYLRQHAGRILLRDLPHGVNLHCDGNFLASRRTPPAEPTR